MAITKAHSKMEPWRSSFNKLYYLYKRGAETRDYNFDLTKDHAFILFKGDCYYCGEKPIKPFISTNGREPFLHNGIDRLDSSAGYIKGNMVSC